MRDDGFVRPIGSQAAQCGPGAQGSRHVPRAPASLEPPQGSAHDAPRLRRLARSSGSAGAPSRRSHPLQLVDIRGRCDLWDLINARPTAYHKAEDDRGTDEEATAGSCDSSDLAPPEATQVPDDSHGESVREANLGREAAAVEPGNRGLHPTLVESPPQHILHGQPAGRNVVPDLRQGLIDKSTVRPSLLSAQAELRLFASAGRRLTPAQATVVSSELGKELPAQPAASAIHVAHARSADGLAGVAAAQSPEELVRKPDRPLSIPEGERCSRCAQDSWFLHRRREELDPERVGERIIVQKKNDMRGTASNSLIPCHGEACTTWKLDERNPFDCIPDVGGKLRVSVHDNDDFIRFPRLQSQRSNGLGELLRTLREMCAYDYCDGRVHDAVTPCGEAARRT